ncbi:MAG: energy transducer TonB [Cyanobacteriota bacterium ELA615]
MYSDPKPPLKISPIINSLPFLLSTLAHIAILAIFLPKISSISSSNTIKNAFNKVNIINLTPAERAQLPNLSTGNVVPAQSVGTLANNAVVSLPLQKSSLPPLPSLPALTPLPNSSKLPPLPVLPPLPPIPTVKPLPYYPRQIARPLLPPLPTFNNKKIIARGSLPQAKLRPKFEPIKQPPKPDDLINERFKTNQTLSQRFNNSGSFDTSNSKLTPQEQWREKLIAQRTAEIQQKRLALEHNGSNTTEQDAMVNYAKWSGNRFGEIKSKPIIYPLDGNYPKEACSSRLEGTAVIGIVVDSTGNVGPEIELIKSSGYPILNQQALAQVQMLRQVPNTTAIARPYLAQVNFQYNPDICKPKSNIVQPEPSSPSPEPTAKKEQ